MTYCFEIVNKHLTESQEEAIRSKETIRLWCRHQAFPPNSKCRGSSYSTVWEKAGDCWGTCCKIEGTRVDSFLSAEDILHDLLH